MLPEVGEPETRFRVEEPAAAVMVTDVALNAAQFRVTFWPLLMAFVFAEKVIVGGTFFRPPQAAAPQIAAISVPQEIQRTASFLMLSYFVSPKFDRARIRCHNPLPWLPLPAKARVSYLLRATLPARVEHGKENFLESRFDPDGDADLVAFSGMGCP